MQFYPDDVVNFIVYYSLILADTERNYDMRNLECLLTVWYVLMIFL